MMHKGLKQYLQEGHQQMKHAVTSADIMLYSTEIFLHEETVLHG